MAFPTLAATNTSNENTNVTSHTVNLPSGIGAGNLIIVIFVVDGVPVITFPAGDWTALYSVDGPASSVRNEAVYREADGTEGGTITVTTDTAQRSAHVSARFTGMEDPDTQAPEAASVGGGTDANPDPPSLTPTSGAKDYLYLAIAGYDDGTQTVTAYPTSYDDNQLNPRADHAGGVGAGFAKRELNADSDDPGTYTISGAEWWTAATVAVHPAAPTTGTIGRAGTLFLGW